MASQFTISLIRVPGHRDIVGNCIADELARPGTIMPLLPGKENVGGANFTTVALPTAIVEQAGFPGISGKQWSPSFPLYAYA